MGHGPWLWQLTNIHLIVGRQPRDKQATRTSTTTTQQLATTAKKKESKCTQNNKPNG
jgi:hypothetical protein